MGSESAWLQVASIRWMTSLSQDSDLDEFYFLGMWRKYYVVMNGLKIIAELFWKERQ